MPARREKLHEQLAAERTIRSRGAAGLQGAYMTSPLQIACMSSPLSPPDTNGYTVMEYRYWTNTNTAQLPHRSARLSSLIFEAALVAAGGVAGAEGLGVALCTRSFGALDCLDMALAALEWGYVQLPCAKAMLR